MPALLRSRGRLALTAAAALLALSGVLTGALAAAPQAGEGSRTLDVDPVELVDHGAERPGLPWLALTRDGITYAFASRENLVAFERTPERYEIQFGGACARMGPLSGACGTDIRAVHRGRLYVFASEQCRESFLAAPERLLESDDPVPVGDVASRKRGLALVELAIEAIGGVGALDAVRSCAERAARTELEGGREYRVVQEAWLAFVPGAPTADRLRRDEAWNSSRWGHVVSRGRGAALSGDRRTALVASQLRAFEKELGRHPLAVLRNRRAPGAVVLHTGSGELDGVPVELVAVALDGRTTTLAIDPASGNLLAMRYRGRTGSAAYADLEVRLSNWRQTGPIRLPFTRSGTVDGKPDPALSVTLDTIEVNGPLAADLFRTFN